MSNNEEPLYIPISLLSEAQYCLRRAWLKWNEQEQGENQYTVAGAHLHERTHEVRIEKKPNGVNFFQYYVISHTLGISGFCDSIEATFSPKGIIIREANEPVLLRPVEYKHGKLRNEREYEIQLCAQAMCLEEMYHCPRIEAGDIFYISSHRRKEITLDNTLRAEVLETIKKIQNLSKQTTSPYPIYSKKCEKCAMIDICLPQKEGTLDIRDYCNSIWE